MKIQALDLSVDLLRVLLWQYNDADKLQSLVRSKQAWYDAAHTGFWTDWITDVFDLRTANDFGLAVWAIILGVSFVVPPSADAADKPIWGFDQYREGFNQGNFATIGGGSGLTTDQKRLVLRLRYFQLVTRGAVPEVNAFMKEVFGNLGGPALAPGLYPQYVEGDVTRTIRAGTATRINAQGYIEAVPVNTPRFTYDPGTLAPLGLLVEAASISRVPNSASAWTPGFNPNAAVVTLNAAPAPDGSSTAVRLQTNAGANVLNWVGSTQMVNGSLYAYSFWMKIESTHPATINVYAGNGASTGGKLFVLTLANKRITGVNNGGAVLATRADGFQRIGMPYQSTQDSNAGNLVFTINGAGSYLLWNRQQEDGPVVTSDILTGAAATTRNADEVHISDPSTVGKVYVADSNKMAIVYVFADPPSSAVESVLTDYDLLPRPAGVRSKLVILGEADGFGFERYHENFSNGNFYVGA